MPKEFFFVLGAKLGPHCSTAGSSELNDECDEGDEAGDDVAEGDS